MNSKIIYLLVFALYFVNNCIGQLNYKYDNKLYPTIYPNDLYKFMKKNPNAVLVDVRTPGEFADTSRFGSLNIGHLKGAINIEIDSILKDPKCLMQYQDQPIILYCSHSQRSRRGSKALKESGFKEVYNLNAGMSYLNQANSKKFPHKEEMIVSSLPYTNSSVAEIISLVEKNNDILIIDLRPAIQFEGKDTLESNNIGRIIKAINIPETEIKNRLLELEKYKSKTIVVYDINGALSHGVSKFLSENGFIKIHNILGGLSAIIGNENSTTKLRKRLLSNTPKYNILNAKEAVDFIKKNKKTLILDLRPQEEYINKSATVWKNLGSIKNSINIPYNEFDVKILTALIDKEGMILIYGTDAMKYCKKLTELGFSNVNCLYGGIWSIISNSANIKERKDDRLVLQNNEGLY